MRTTIDIPDELLRRAKAAAALRGLKLKDLIATFVERGLDASSASREVQGHKMPLPEFIPKTGNVIRSLSGSEMEEILIREELESLGRDRPAGR